MKLKHLLLTAAVAASWLGASAQTQGYEDGVEYFKVEEYANAQELLDKYLNEPNTDKATALYYLGAIRLKANDTEGARKYFDEGVAADPKNGLNYVGLGALDLKNLDAKAAEKNFKTAQKDKNKAKIFTTIARAYYDADPVTYQKEITDFLQKAKNKNAKEAEIYVLEGDMLRDKAIAAGVDDGTSVGAAAEQYSQAIFFNPDSPEAYVKYSRVYGRANPTYAIDKLKEYIARNPQSAMAQRELAERYYENDRWKEAADQYGEYIANPNHFPSDEERYSVLLYANNDFAGSLKAAEEMLKIDPNSMQMKRMAFLDLERLGRFEEARTAAQRMFADNRIKFTPNDYLTYANVLNKVGDRPGEIAAYEEAVKLAPERPTAYGQLSNIYSVMGDSAKLKNDSVAALTDYNKSLDYYKQYIDRIGADKLTANDNVMLSIRYQDIASVMPANDPERPAVLDNAAAAADAVIAVAPDSYVPYRQKARIILAKNGGKPDEATAAAYTKLIEVLDKDPENLTKRANVYAEAYNRLGGYYIGQKNKVEAKKWYSKMLEMQPNNENLRKYVESL